MKPAWRDRAAAIFGLGIGCVAIEMLLVGKIDAQETPVGVALALAAALAATGALATAHGRYAPRLRMLAGLPALAVSVMADTMTIIGALWNALRGRPPEDRFEEIPLEDLGDDAVSAASRAAAICAASAAPNSIVVDVDRERGVLLVHRLVS